MPEIQLLRSVHVTYIHANKLRFSEILSNKELYGTIVKTHCSEMKHSYSPSPIFKIKLLHTKYIFRVLSACRFDISDLNCSAY